MFLQERSDSYKYICQWKLIRDKTITLFQCITFVLFYHLRYSFCTQNWNQVESEKKRVKEVHVRRGAFNVFRSHGFSLSLKLQLSIIKSTANSTRSIRKFATALGGTWRPHLSRFASALLRNRRIARHRCNTSRTCGRNFAHTLLTSCSVPPPPPL